MPKPSSASPMHPNHLTQLMNRADALQQHVASQNHGIKFAFQANELAVRKVLDDTIAALRFLDLSGEEYGTIELVLAEVMNNIVEHAYASAPDGMIELKITPGDKGLNCELRDEGQPMPNGVVPLGHLPAVNMGPMADICDLPEGGFGWFLIRDLAHNLEYSRQDGNNILTFRIATNHQNLHQN